MLKKYCNAMLALVAVTATGLASGGLAGEVTADRLLAAGTDAEVENWLMVHKTYDSNRYSALNQINAGNVGDMRLAFAVPLGGLEPSGFGAGYMEGTPLVDNGFMYVADPWGTPYKIDVSSGNQGRILWVCDTDIEKDATAGVLLAHRGLALSGNNVITALNDGRVVACDTETGDVVWEKQVATDAGEGFTSAPLVIGDKILVGQSYGDWATRGWLAALDADSGEELWRFYVVPEPGMPGSETWLCEETGNPDCWKTGGGALWVTGSYDPGTNTTYWGTGNPVPMFDPEFRPGDNLYTNSTIAIDADTGELKWHFQYTPGDYLDYDEVGTQLLMDVNVDGEDRKVLSHFGRNGLFYSLDRNNGSYISSAQYVTELTWTEGIDPKTGWPVEYDPSASLQTYAVGALRRGGGKIEHCPHITGGINFYPTAYNPLTGVAYGAGQEGCSELEAIETAPEDIPAGVVILGGTYAGTGAQTGSISAIDVSTNTPTVKHGTPYPNHSGVLVTQDLVWTGSLDGTISAHDTKTLETAWSMNVGTAFRAPPMTYAVNGKQFIAIEGGPIGGNGNGHVELENMQQANMIWVFAVD
jgi:alcohol dehydrogenase (cytochrome c)|tara:strand:+ start:12390 stop:14144 length:1755 start_codon:yes stop_codon:yes gene_type:complete